uniref:Phosphatidylinositol glycan anchor biosynthesis class K n=1 Tax=Rousettus aegyptiacus TaxID=9407 RepID=A0A7J8KEF7_ROUAE|nr:phosphatidylinositol glycan anchor biosynthesis class K [Rousettus aegyptiacus]
MVATYILSQGVSAFAVLLLLSFDSLATSQIEDQTEQFFRSGHTNNWAVLVCTSRFWFNYRHVANTLSVYRSVKRLGIPDSYKEDWMDEEIMEPLKYAEQLPVAQIIHQKPKPKDWHPPGGFILGLWALIIMVFFKTYGIKHMKFIF